MLQQVMTAPGVIEFREVDVPEVGNGQVLIKIMRIGVCGSDIHVYHGKHPFTKADVIYDCAGNNITMGQAIKYARKGSTISMACFLKRTTKLIWTRCAMKSQIMTV